MPNFFHSTLHVTRAHKPLTEQSGTQTVPVEASVSHCIEGYQRLKWKKKIKKKKVLPDLFCLLPGCSVSHHNFRKVISEGYKIK